VFGWAESLSTLKVSEGLDVLPVEVKAARGGALRSVFQFLGKNGRSRAIFFASATNLS
jgi:hypothetical protein